MLSLIELGFLNYKLNSYVSFSSLLFFYLFSSTGFYIEGLVYLYISINVSFFLSRYIKTKPHTHEKITKNKPTKKVKPNSP